MKHCIHICSVLSQEISLAAELRLQSTGIEEMRIGESIHLSTGDDTTTDKCTVSCLLVMTPHQEISCFSDQKRWPKECDVIMYTGMHLLLMLVCPFLKRLLLTVATNSMLFCVEDFLFLRW